MSKSPSINKKQLIELYRSALQSHTPLESVEAKMSALMERNKATSKMERRQVREHKERVKKQLPWIVRVGAYVLPAGFMSIGLFLVGNAVLPIGSYYLQTLPQLTRSDLLTPIPREQVLDITPMVIDTSDLPQVALADAKEEQDGPIILDTKLDYTNLANWFSDGGTVQVLTDIVSESFGSVVPEESTVYTVDIPKLNITNAQVKVGGTNLNQSLIQYPGTALPGDAGSPVIFGHSVLRQFYNPSEKNPRRYVSIFSTIMTLKNGDNIFITRDGVKYTYVVREKTEVKPEDVYILNQNYDSKQLKLVTCVPEGTYLRRGVITAQLVQ